MTSRIRFAPELGHWLTQHLDRGQLPQTLVDLMGQRGMDAGSAQSIVMAFVEARRRRQPLPVDSIEIPDATPAAGAARLAGGTRINAGDREVLVHARTEAPVFATLGNVMDAQECRALIDMARPRLKPSTLVDPASGRDVVSTLRSSFGMFFQPGENELVSRLDQRLSALMNLPVENGEGLQVLHYQTGAGSEPHFDYLQPANAANRGSIARSGQRVSTLVTYLNDVPEGGQTVFPNLGWSVSPLRGNAVYFEYCDAAGRVDPRSLHASAPVLRGEKWVVTKWMRQRRFVSA